MNRVGVGAIVAAGLLVAGCSKEASGQSVAVVNDEEISQSEVNAELAASNVPPSADKKQVLPAIVQRIVDRKLLAQAAVKEGIDRSPEYLTQQRRMNEDLLINLMTKRRADSTKLPTQPEIDAFIAANPAMFSGREVLKLNQLAFDPPSDLSVLSRFAEAHSLDAVAELLTKLGITYARGEGALDTASLSRAVYEQISKLPPGEPFALPAQGKIVVSTIVGREPKPTPPDDSRRLAAEALRRQRVQTTMDGRLKELRGAAKIEYQAGFAPPAPKSKK